MDFTIVRPLLKRTRDAVLGLYETSTFSDVVYTIEDPNVAKAEQATEAAATEAATEAAATEATEAATEATEAATEADITVQDFYRLFVERTEDECAIELAAPQRSAKWLDARRYAITASNFGAAAGHNKYMGPDALVLDKLWATFKGNAYTAYGTFHEPDARQTLEALLSGPLYKTLLDIYMKYTGLQTHVTWTLFETGLLKYHKQPWMAVSPDGLLKLEAKDGPSLVILVEYKCPARLRDSDGHPYGSSPKCVPEYYMDQMQGIMGLFNKYPEILKSVNVPESPIPESLFVVWQPHQVHVTRVPFEREYYFTSLEPALRSWYFQKYLPMAVLKHNNVLIYGTTTTSEIIKID